MATAGDWIVAAYNRSSQNDPGKLAQDSELLLHLNRVYQRLWALIGRARPDEMGGTAALVLAGAPPQVTIPSEAADILAVRNASGARVNVIPSTEIERLWHMAPSVYRLGNLLISRNKTGDPIAGATLTVILLDAPTALTTLATVIDTRFPVRHHQMPIDTLALYLQTKDAGREEGDRAALLQELRVESAAFAAEYNLPPAALEWLHGAAEHTPAPA